METWLVIGGLFVAAVGFLFPKVRGYFIDKKIKDLIVNSAADQKQLEKDVAVVNKKEAVTVVVEAKLDQKLEDLKKEKINESDIADFITQMEKNSNDK